MLKHHPPIEGRRRIGSVAAARGYISQYAVSATRSQNAAQDIRAARRPRLKMGEPARAADAAPVGRRDTDDGVAVSLARCGEMSPVDDTRGQ